MSLPLRIRTTVLPGHRIEISNATLDVGDAVDVVVIPQILAPKDQTRRSLIEIVAGLKGHRRLKSADEVEVYLRQEHDAWE